jgi:hypothetical protein
MPEPAGPSPPSPPAFTWGALLFLAVSILLGIGYLAWVTAIEGRRVWIVAGLVALIAACAAIAHWAMGRTRDPHPPTPLSQPPPRPPGEGEEEKPGR